MPIAQSVTDLIGKTPLVKINRLSEGLYATVLVKLEYTNPSSSLKDRIALSMIEALEKTGTIQKDSILIEATSGNTGIGLAMVCAARGYRLTIVMPETMSCERRMLLKAYGAEIILTPGSEGILGAIERLQQLVRQDKRYIDVGQFENPANPHIHRKTTAEEIWNDTDGMIDIFVAGVGTGGTITGVGETLKAKKPSIQVIAVEPAGSPILSGGSKGQHAIQGIGTGFIPAVLNVAVYDRIMTVTDQDAFKTARLAGTQEGLLIGISSGATLWCALELAKDKNNKGKVIVSMVASCGERYLSTELYAHLT